MTSRTVLIAPLVALAMLTAACGGGGSEQQSSDKTVGERAATTTEVENTDGATEESAAEETTTEETATEESASSEEETTLSFDNVYTYEDGLSVYISAPEHYEPTEIAAGADDHEYAVQFNVTLTNDSSASVPPYEFSSSILSGSRQGELIADTDLDSTLAFELLEGRSAAFVLAFAVDDPEDLVLTVTPAFDRQSLRFTY
jgi:hypothetical protein